MAKKSKSFSDEIRAAIAAAAESKYAICKATHISQSRMSKFMHGSANLSLEALDTLAAHLDLHVISGNKKK